MNPDPVPDVIAKLLAFREEYRDRYGTLSPSTPSDIGQILALNDARLLAVSIILDIAPDLLEGWLDHVVWESDLTTSSLNAVRNRGGIAIPPLSDFNMGENMHRTIGR